MKPSTITGPCRSATRSDATGAQTPRCSSPALSPDISEYRPARSAYSPRPGGLARRRDDAGLGKMSGHATRAIFSFHASGPRAT